MDAALSELRAGKPFPEVVAGFLAAAAEEMPSPAWEALGATDLAADVKSATTWLARQFQERWPPPDLSGLRFGLYPVRGPRPGRVELVLALSGGSRYPDADWLSDLPWDPVGYAPTPGLRSLLPLAADAADDVRAVVREPLALVYAVGLVAATFDAVEVAGVVGDRPQLGVVAGFPDGDLVVVGVLTAGGLDRAMERVPRPAPPEEPPAAEQPPAGGPAAG